MAGLDELFGQEINGSSVLFLAVVTLIGLYYLVNKHQKRMHPPSYGWIPYIGCAVAFGKSPLHFINWATQKVIVLSCNQSVLFKKKKGLICKILCLWNISLFFSFFCITLRYTCTGTSGSYLDSLSNIWDFN